MARLISQRGPGQVFFLAITAVWRNAEAATVTGVEAVVIHPIGSIAVGAPSDVRVAAISWPILLVAAIDGDHPDKSRAREPVALIGTVSVARIAVATMAIEIHVVTAPDEPDTIVISNDTRRHIARPHVSSRTTRDSSHAA